jgi:ArsR family transcriptional regulator, arsenate/arsenite/antimonite-responsive transcriptional repressor / arsenate reductase (thioredoxin)
MMAESNSSATNTMAARAALHRALGDETRLAMVTALELSDRSPKELGELVRVPTNLLAFHLDVLEEVGLIARTASQGDARRRYVTLVRERLGSLTAPAVLEPVERVLFVCTANSARSQLAAHLWQARTGLPALSAGTEPAEVVHPLAVTVARRGGLDLADAAPTSYHDVDLPPDLVVSVCDRAHESEIAFDVLTLHWSVPDPVGGDVDTFARTFEDLAERIDLLARAATGQDPLVAAPADAPRSTATKDLP